ncbi:hypothetical protein SECTIM467_97 [Brevibacillus phage SecTim467]|uniref:Uncharacterized protein n=2 Tax=Jenstvirus jenst TaxID=1982225 RepID=A0A0K2CNZ0_9CAUD|nr:hypothetical protein AVV11_gp099 [Brevibacillus phage Jenst]ALA07221.1 hypothetical protein JENST_92 [Brevibacillus phage Jenst]ALA07438.1 hypothetical protein SECTIM467_97 [Brevibacillus phage SecTim467]
MLNICVTKKGATAYEDDFMNFNCLCKECHEEEEEYWAERWAEYYAGRL